MSVAVKLGDIIDFADLPECVAHCRRHGKDIRVYEHEDSVWYFVLESNIVTHRVCTSNEIIRYLANAAEDGS